MKSYVNESCACGKVHAAEIDEVVIGSGAVNRLPEFLEKYGSNKLFILADENTFAAAGEIVCSLIKAQGKEYSSHIFGKELLEPDEHAVGSVIMHFDNSCDLIIGIGSGVINDIGKILSKVSGRKYIIVATAPSMDGYASSTSSMVRDNLKVSIDSRCADVIIGDTDILKNAPLHMFKAGIGDMVAKYVSIAEWRIGNLLSGEYYCETIAELVRSALKKCTDNAAGLLNRDEKAVEAVFEGLVISGVAMSYTGLSRPASGVEHYFSHVWDMRSLEFGTKLDRHGVQCALGTLCAVRLYEKLIKTLPDKEKALAWVKEFNLEAWHSQLRAFLGNSAEVMIALEEKEHKYSKASHAERIEKIAEYWGEICKIIEEELPASVELEALFDLLCMPKSLSYMELEKAEMELTFKATKDVRDKYILSRLAWDLGMLDELSEEI